MQGCYSSAEKKKGKKKRFSHINWNYCLFSTLHSIWWIIKNSRGCCNTRWIFFRGAIPPPPPPLPLPGTWGGGRAQSGILRMLWISIARCRTCTCICSEESEPPLIEKRPKPKHCGRWFVPPNPRGVTIMSLRWRSDYRRCVANLKAQNDYWRQTYSLPPTKTENTL